MEKEAEKFLQAEETAVKLVETLKQLHTEATSYKTATKELDAVRQQLIGLIESTKKVASGTHEVIKILMEIGTPEILKKIEEVEILMEIGTPEILKKIEEVGCKVESKVDEESLKISRVIDSLKTETSEKITNMENRVTQEFIKQSRDISNLKILIIVTLASSITAVIIGIIALLR